MIRHIIRLMLIPIILSTTSFSLQAAAAQFVIDEKHSYVLWRINHLGFSNQTGKWFVTGSLVLDKEQPQLSKVSIKIDMSKIITGIPELDKHLKDASFLDVAKYPESTFVSDKVEVLSNITAKVQGQLTLHGVTKPITLMVTFNKEGKSPITDNVTVGFNATTKLKRSDFGIMTLLPSLGDEVDIEISAEAYQPKA